MSELITTRTCANIRLQLLATVSALTLLTVIASRAQAEDTNRPTVWIELGGQLERVDGGQEQFTPPFILAAPQTATPLSVGHPPRRSFGGEGKISFEPEDSNWVFSAGVRFGRSNAHKHLHKQSYQTKPGFQLSLYGSSLSKYQYVVPFSDVDRKDSESHTVLDFQAGKDVGMGLFGQDSTSVFSVGVRFAQFGSKTHMVFKSDPDAHFTSKYIPLAGGISVPTGNTYHSYAAEMTATRSFHGIGPSLSWTASAPLLGNADEGEIAFDWGINGALLFGRQKTIVQHQTTARYHSGTYGRGAYGKWLTTLYRHTPPDQIRSRSVTVPNVGAFAGLSFRYDAAKVSFGYRADFFFGAMDGGIDTRKTYDRNFYGPFATISVGLGG